MDGREDEQSTDARDRTEIDEIRRLVPAWAESVVDRPIGSCGLTRKKFPRFFVGFFYMLGGTRLSAHVVFLDVFSFIFIVWRLHGAPQNRTLDLLQSKW